MDYEICSPIALLAREITARRGTVAAELGGLEVGPGKYRLIDGAFLLHTASGIAYRYRKGEGVTIDAPLDVEPAEIELWLNGTVYAAIACINGLLPIHASAVAHRGRVFAFSGPSGSGKSTLVAALGARGLPLFCDDTLVLHLAGDGAPLCLPGHKRLKLAPDSLVLTGATQREKVSGMIDKFFADPPGGTVREALPLGALTFLEGGAEPRFESVEGAARLALLNDDHYTADLYIAARGADAEARFANLVGMARRIPTVRFTRPLDSARFGEAADAAAAFVRSWATV